MVLMSCPVLWSWSQYHLQECGYGIDVMHVTVDMVSMSCAGLWTWYRCHVQDCGHGLDVIIDVTRNEMICSQREANLHVSHSAACVRLIIAT